MKTKKSEIEIGMEEIIGECDICGMKFNKEMYKIEKKLFDNEMPCSCNIINEVIKLKKKIKLLKKEIRFLNNLLSEVGESDWDAEGLYDDAYLGTFNGNNIGGVPDKKYAKWLAKRYGLKIDKDGQRI